MKKTRSEMKVKALELMEQLKLNPLFEMRFFAFDKIAYFEKHTPLFGDVQNVVLEKVKEIEKDQDLLVYAVTSDEMQFGKCYSFLVVSPYEEDWNCLLWTEGTLHFVYAYVWNTTDEWRSESGRVILLNENGKLVRIG